MPRQTARAGDRLPEKEVEKGIGLSSRSIEHVYRGQHPTASPAVRSDPMRLGARCLAAELRGQGVTITNYTIVARILQPRLGAFQIERASVTVVHRCRDVVGDFALEDQPYALRLKIPALISEGTRKRIGQDLTTYLSELTNPGQRRIRHAVAVKSSLHAVLALTVRKRNLLMMCPLERR